MNGGTSGRAEQTQREAERLTRRILHIDRFGRDRWWQMALLYRLADGYGKRVFLHSLCRVKVSAHSGCLTGECCRCRPDVFALEKDLLDRLPKPLDPAPYCPFFNLAKKTCGIYGVRPFACRIYYNVATSRYHCQNPEEATLHLFETLKRHVEKVLGPHLGGYQVG